jgi:hypothetical protein
MYCHPQRPNWEVLDDTKCPPRLASETDNKDALAPGKNRSTLLPNIPPHTEIKVTAEGLGARPALLPAQQPRQLSEVRHHAPRYIQFILSARATRHQADWSDGVDRVAMLIEGRPFDPCNSLWLRL